MKKQIVKLFFFLALMMVSVVGKGQNWTWTGEAPAAGGSYYLYNVGFKGFLNYTGSVSVTENNKPNTLWSFSSTTSGTISTSYNNRTYYVYVEKTLIGGDASIRTNSATVTIAASSKTSGAYKIQHTKSGIASGTRYFNVESDTKVSAASTDGLNNDWYLISDAQKTVYDNYYNNYVAAYKALETFEKSNNISSELKTKVTSTLTDNNIANYSDVEKKIGDINSVLNECRKSIVPEDKSGLIVNPEAEDGTNGWTGEFGILGGDGAHFFEPAGWWKTSATMSQTVTGLPNGYYVLQMKYQAAEHVKVTLAGNTASNYVQGTNEGWKDLGVVCQVNDGSLTITASSEVTDGETQFTWFNTDHFTLTYYGDADPGLTYEVGEKIDGTYLNQQPVYTGADESKTALLVISYINNYTNDPKHEYGIKPGAMATVETNKGSQEVELKPDPTPYNENSFAIYIENFDENETYRVTIPAGSYGYIGEPSGTNKEIYLEAVQSPLHDGKYFVVVKGTGKHVSRGKGWGTQAILDYYGVPMTVQTSGQTVFRFLDSGAFMGSGTDDDWMYTDKNTSDVKEIRRYILIPGTGEHEGEYQFYNPIRKKYLYHAVPDDRDYDAVFEGAEGAWFQFEALNAKEYTDHLNTIRDDEAMRVAERTGLVVASANEYFAKINELEESIKDSDGNVKEENIIFPKTEAEKTVAAKYFEKKNAELACAVDWEGTPRDLVGGEKVRIPLKAGMYIMNCDAFQQAMSLATLQENQGFRGLTYMYVKVGDVMYKSQLKSITETSGTIPTDATTAEAALDAHTYQNRVLFYVSSDDTEVEFGVENPQRLGNGIDETAGSWVAFKNIQIEQLSGALEEANMKVAAGKYGTFIAPYDVEMPAGVTAYSGSLNDAKTSVSLTSVAAPGQTLAACTPVIVMNEGEKDINITYRDFDVRDDKTTTSEKKDILVGFYVAGEDVPNGSYVLQDQGQGQKFYKVSTEAITGVKNRCYLDASSASVKVLNFEFADEETAIESLANGATIVEYYSVNGSKLSAPQKGINLVKMSDSTVKKIFVK